MALAGIILSSIALIASWFNLIRWLQLKKERARYRSALHAVREEISGCLQRDTDAFAQMTLDQVEHWNVSRHMQSHSYCLDQIDAALNP